MILALLLAVPLVVLWRPLLLGETFYQEDLGAYYFPRERLLQRTGLTGWNPHVFMGIGLAGDPQTAAYEPLRRMARAGGLSDRLGLVFYVEIYLVIAIAGSWVLARRFGASDNGAALAVLAFVWGGAYIVRFRHPWNFASMALIPWIAWVTDRLVTRCRLADALLIGILIAWGALGGHPQLAYMSWLFVVVYVTVGVWTARSSAARVRALGTQWLRIGASMAVFCGLLAGYYAPVIIQLLHSARGSSGLAFAGSFSFSPWDWLRLLAPDLYGNDLAGTHFGTRNYHEQTCYLGIAPLALFVLAFWWQPGGIERRLGAIAVGFFALSAGKFLPPFYIAYFLLPGFRLFRDACRYTVFFTLLGGMVAGLVLTRIAKGERPSDASRVRRQLGRLLAIVASVFSVCAVIAWAWPGMDRFTEPGAHWTTAWAAARAAFWLYATRTLLDAWLACRLSPRWTVRGLVALTCFDLALQWLPYRQSLPPNRVYPDPSVVQALASAAPARVFVQAFNRRGQPEIVPLLNWGEGALYDDLRGYNQAAPADVLELLSRADVSGRSLALPDALGGFEPADWLLDLAAVTRIAARTGEWPARWQNLPLEAEGGGWQVRRRGGALPRAWLVGAVERSSWATTVSRLEKIDPRQLAIVEEGEALDLPGPSQSGPAGDVQLVGLRPDEVTLIVEATRPALVILSDRIDVGWSVEVDGAPRRLLRADGLLRATEVTPGKHQVLFRYRANDVGGGYITIATVGLLAVGLFASWVRHASRRHPSPRPGDIAA